MVNIGAFVERGVICFISYEDIPRPYLIMTSEKDFRSIWANIHDFKPLPKKKVVKKECKHSWILTGKLYIGPNEKDKFVCTKCLEARYV